MSNSSSFESSNFLSSPLKEGIVHLTSEYLLVKSDSAA